MPVHCLMAHTDFRPYYAARLRTRQHCADIDADGMPTGQGSTGAHWAEWGGTLEAMAQPSAVVAFNDRAQYEQANEGKEDDVLSTRDIGREACPKRAPQ
jgi:hypothetical protein